MKNLCILYRDQLKAAFEALMLCEKEKIARFSVCIKNTHLSCIVNPSSIQSSHSQLKTLSTRLSTLQSLDPVSLLFQVVFLPSICCLIL